MTLFFKMLLNDLFKSKFRRRDVVLFQDGD
jgi:hypothetical protein